MHREQANTDITNVHIKHKKKILTYARSDAEPRRRRTEIKWKVACKVACWSSWQITPAWAAQRQQHCRGIVYPLPCVSEYDISRLVSATSAHFVSHLCQQYFSVKCEACCVQDARTSHAHRRQKRSHFCRPIDVFCWHVETQYIICWRRCHVTFYCGCLPHRLSLLYFSDVPSFRFQLIKDSSVTSPSALFALKLPAVLGSQYLGLQGSRATSYSLLFIVWFIWIYWKQSVTK